MYRQSESVKSPLSAHYQLETKKPTKSGNTGNLQQRFLADTRAQGNNMQ